jgi:hypothetical protein
MERGNESAGDEETLCNGSWQLIAQNDELLDWSRPGSG